jgi:hypothetical protein
MGAFVKTFQGVCEYSLSAVKERNAYVDPNTAAANNNNNNNNNEYITTDKGIEYTYLTDIVIPERHKLQKI